MSGKNTGAVWAVAEHVEGDIKSSTWEVIAFASEVARKSGAPLVAVVLGRPISPLAEQISRIAGCDVIGINSRGGEDYNFDAYRFLLASAYKSHKPRFIFIPHTPVGWDYAPALAVDIQSSCITAVSDMHEENGVVFTREICNGKILEDVRAISNRPAVVTVMPGARRPLAWKGGSGNVTITEMEAPPARMRTVRRLDAPACSLRLKEAEVIVAAGRGIKREQHLDIIRKLADSFERGVVGASRPVCDMGWLPFDYQVGMTGQTVSPKVYIACGISGAIQHTMGMKGSNLIVAINTDKNALICKVSNYCIEEDLHKFIPILIERIRKYKEK